MGAVKAQPGDWIVVEATHVGEARRRGEVLEVRGDDGDPPFLVRWSDGDHEALVFPGGGAHVVTADQAAAEPPA